MGFEKLLYSVEDGVAVITMNYIKNLNAIDEQMAEELKKARSEPLRTTTLTLGSS